MSKQFEKVAKNMPTTTLELIADGSVVSRMAMQSAAKRELSKRKLKGMKLARKMKKEGATSSDIVQETGYNI